MINAEIKPNPNSEVRSIVVVATYKDKNGMEYNAVVNSANDLPGFFNLCNREKERFIVNRADFTSIIVFLPLAQ